VNVAEFEEWAKLLEENLDRLKGKGAPDLVVQLLCACATVEGQHRIADALEGIRDVIDAYRLLKPREKDPVEDPGLAEYRADVDRRITDLSGSQARIALRAIADGHWLSDALDIAGSY